MFMFCITVDNSGWPAMMGYAISGSLSSYACSTVVIVGVSLWINKRLLVYLAHSSNMMRQKNTNLFYES